MRTPVCRLPTPRGYRRVGGGSLCAIRCLGVGQRGSSGHRASRSRQAYSRSARRGCRPTRRRCPRQHGGCLDRGRLHPADPPRRRSVALREHRDFRERIECFAACLRDAGVDVSRITTGVPVLHPQLFSMSSLWERDKGVTERRYRVDPSQDAILANSPIRSAYDGNPFSKPCDDRCRAARISHSHGAAQRRRD